MKIYKMFTVLGMVASFFSFAGSAKAQEVTLRVEPGAAVPLTSPQTQRFDVGASVAVKPELSLGSYLSLGPSLQAVQLPSRLSGVDAGSALSYGGFLRLKRPHDEKNTGQGLSALSPWVDADLRVVHTGSLTRLGASVAVGAQVPTSDSRWLWVGPFVRYDLVNQDDKQGLLNTNSAKTLLFGLSFEFGAATKPKAVPNHTPTPPPVSEPLPPVAQDQPKSEPTPTSIVATFNPKVQFAWDSSVLQDSQLSVLLDVVKSLEADKNLKVTVEGHASSEGQAKHNDNLSVNRAQSVVDFLVAHGVDKNRLTVKGFGSRVPVEDNSTEAGRVANRRVEFDVTFTLVKGGK